MKTCGLIANRIKEDAFKHVKSASAWLNEHGVVCCAESDIAGIAAAKPMPRSRLFTECDFLIVLGGDGTMLDIAAQACMSGIPVLGVNLGRLGYLTDTEPQNMTNALVKIIGGAYEIEDRLTLKSNSDTVALNEFCVFKGAGSHMIAYDIMLNGAYINTYRADGIIIATPTGSTAYNLSAGGPILKPDGDMIAITPICPHGLFARPFVVSARDEITVRLPDINASALLSADGKQISELSPGAAVEIRACEKPFRIIKTNDFSFFDVLRNKMGSI